jgi:hypothetical protein
VIVTNPNVFGEPAGHTLECFLRDADRVADLAAELRRRVLYLHSSGQLTLPVIEAAALAVRVAAGEMDWPHILKLAGEIEGGAP